MLFVICGLGTGFSVEDLLGFGVCCSGSVESVRGAEP